MIIIMMTYSTGAKNAAYRQISIQLSPRALIDAIKSYFDWITSNFYMLSGDFGVFQLFSCP